MCSHLDEHTKKRWKSILMGSAILSDLMSMANEGVWLRGHNDQQPHATWRWKIIGKRPWLQSGCRTWYSSYLTEIYTESTLLLKDLFLMLFYTQSTSTSCQVMMDRSDVKSWNRWIMISINMLCIIRAISNNRAACHSISVVMILFSKAYNINAQVEVVCLFLIMTHPMSLCF